VSISVDFDTMWVSLIVLFDIIPLSPADGATSPPLYLKTTMGSLKVGCKWTASEGCLFALMVF
jgi:hypothetical protein